jgi:hypothetical protein
MIHRCSVRTWLMIVASFSVVERVTLWMWYPLQTTNDTLVYVNYAKNLLKLGFDRYRAARLPGYPLFIAMLGVDDARVYAVQLVLGLLTTLLFFYIGYRITGKEWFGALVALAHTLNPGQLFFETYLMSETLTTFTVVVILAITAYLFYTPSPARSWKAAYILLVAFLAGLFAVSAVMTRPLFIFLPFVVALFFLFGSRTELSALDWKLKLGTALVVCIPTILAVSLWVNFIHAKFKVWGLDPIGGYHLVNNTGTFFEYVPDEYAAIRDVYIDYRMQRLAERGTQINTIWDAIPALQKAAGLNYYALSRLLTDISWQLIREHPGLYLSNLASGWWWFWLAPVYWSPEDVINPLARQMVSAYIFLGRAVTFGCNMMFLFASLVSALLKKVRSFLRVGMFERLLVSIVLTASIVQTLGEHGDNARFLIPLQSTIVFLVLLWAVRAVGWLGKNERVSSALSEKAI